MRERENLVHNPRASFVHKAFKCDSVLTTALIAKLCTSGECKHNKGRVICVGITTSDNNTDATILLEGLVLLFN